MKYKDVSLFFSLSALPVCIALARLSSLTPWIDEVMFIDTPMHYLKGMGWTTHAWYSIAGQPPFLLYPPLYSMILVPWMLIFGTSILACRSLNIVITLFIGWGLLRILRLLTPKLSFGQILLLSALLWCVGDMVYMYSNGRPDLMGAFILVLIAGKMIQAVKYGTRAWSIFVLSALLMVTALQTAVCLLLSLLLSYILLKRYRKAIKHPALLSISGLFLGFTVNGAFMAYHGHLISFVVNIFSYSGSAKAITASILTTMGHYMDIDTAYLMGKLSKMGAESPLYVRLLSMFSRPSYILLLMADSVSLLIHMKRIKKEPCYPAIQNLFILSVGIPLLMVLAGRFEPYYYWMAYLPLFLLTVLLFRPADCYWGNFTIGLLLLCILANYKIPENKNNHYEKMASFINHCTMLNDKQVIAPFSVFYEISELSINTYYLGIFPPQNLPKKIDYIILPERSADYGNYRLYNYFETIRQSDSLTVVMVAQNQCPKLEVYKIEAK